MRDLVLDRIVNGRQQIRVAISFHMAGRLVVWPYGYTSVDAPPTMTALDARTFEALGRSLAASNGYQPVRWGVARIVSGDSIDWLYGSQRIFAFLFEMGTAWRVPDEQIGPETRRNRDAVLSLMEQAGCPYAAIGAADRYCGPLFDDLEIERGWTTDPDGTDGATAGAWRRGVPAAGPAQLATTASGRSVLVTGRPAGRDVDGGTTSVPSPIISLPAGRATLHLEYWFAMGADATGQDRFVVRLVASDGALLATALSVTGDGSDHPPAWTSLRYPMPSGLTGGQIAIELVATDGGGDSTVEAGVDEVRVTQGP